MISSARLERIIRLGLLVLVALMPLHAFLSVWLGSLTGHQAVIQAWKEVLLLVLTAGGIVLLAKKTTARQHLENWPARLAFGFITIALLVTAFTQPSITSMAFGAKTDIEFIVACLLAMLVTTPMFVRQLIKVIVISACVVVTFGVLQSSILPPDFLTHFGYGPQTIQPYLTLDPAIQSLRFGSTLGGPNQLGTYLLLPLALAATLAFRRRQWWHLALLTGGLPVMINTQSRSAWLGTLLAAGIIIFALTPAKARAVVLALIGVLGIAASLLASRLIEKGSQLQYYLLHSNAQWHGARGSDFEHLSSLQQGVSLVMSRPLGHGLGTAGPATFHAGTPIIIENNYLQIAYETGLGGMALFLALIGSVMVNLARRAKHNDLAVATLAALAGISLVALVWPAWTDSTTALTVWVAAGSAIGLKIGEHSVSAN